MLSRHPHLPHADPEFAPDVLIQRTIVLMVDLGRGRKDQLVALFRQAEGEFLVFIDEKAAVEAIIEQEDVATISCAVGVDEIDAL